MEENAQLIVDKQNRSAYKFSLLPGIHLFNSIWENLVLSKGFFLEISLSVGNAYSYFWPFTIIALFTVSFSYLHYNVIQRGCEAISG